MSGLIAYGSSDDEDQEQAEIVASGNVPTSNSGHKAAGSEANNDPAIGNAEPAADGQAPMMGPAIPSDHSFDNGHYDEDNDLADMSERDAIRVLTQASHPMRELPPSPPGSPNLDSSAKFKRFLEMKKQGSHFNDNLANKNAFKNPGFLQAMMSRTGIHGESQHRSSLPPAVFDATALPAIGYKEVLLESQHSIRRQSDAEKKAHAVAGTRTIDFQSQGSLR